MYISKFFDIESDFNYDKERQNFIDNMNMLKSMNVEEAALYKKWKECLSLRSRYDKSKYTKFNIWIPSNIYDYKKTISEIESLRPRLKLITDENDMMEWANIRIFVSTHIYEQTPGRMLRFIVYDEITQKYLGAISLSSDVPKIAVRDNYIGWTNDNKFSNKKLDNTSIASCIIATQPFGYNFLGGKLVAALLSTEYVRDCWKNIYNNSLVGITTTSLYGINSMYNGIPYWKTLGESAGKVYIKPDDDIYDVWHHWLQENKSVEYMKAITPNSGVNGPVTGVKQKIIVMIMNQLDLKLKDYIHGYKRGVFFLPIYENTNNFLKNEISENELKLKDRLKSDYEGVIQWWIDKAKKRYTKLFNENKLKPEILFYNKLPFMTWEETKNEFLKEVGR